MGTSQANKDEILCYEHDVSDLCDVDYDAGTITIQHDEVIERISSGIRNPLERFGWTKDD